MVRCGVYTRHGIPSPSALMNAKIPLPLSRNLVYVYVCVNHDDMGRTLSSW